MSSNEIAVSIRGVGKKYILQHKGERHNTLAESLLARIKRGGRGSDSKEAFWALQDVSFDIKQGEVVGVVGRNGAGKSTLLKILSRITEPSRGEIRLQGRVGSLLEVGTGFSPELTGRENIFLNGSILGMKRAEIQKHFDAIVDFAGVEKFLDTPVKRYSSGMYVRLAFAVAAHLETEILIIDEVLAVGDAEFQKKCLGKMQDVSRSQGRTVLFVSHNMGAVTALCTSGVLLAKGKVLQHGTTDEIIAAYNAAGKEQLGERKWHDLTQAPGNDRVRITAVRTACGNSVTTDVPIDQPFRVEIEYVVLTPGLRLQASIHLLDQFGGCIFATFNAPSASLSPDPWYGKSYPNGKYVTTCTVPGSFLNSQMYQISAFVYEDSTRIEAAAKEVISVSIHDTGEMRKEYTGNWIGMIRPRFAWNTENIGSHFNEVNPEKQL